MQAAEKRKQEQNNLKSLRITHIIECTYTLFAEKGIDTITMNEIAAQAEIGVASLYRYFSTKDDLSIECATYVWEKEETLFGGTFRTADYALLTGYDQIQALLEIFPKMLRTQGKFFRFIYYFDSYVKRQNVSPEHLSKYEMTIANIKTIVMNALAKGRRDGSVTFNINKNGSLVSATDSELYFTMMHSLFSLAQKLSLSGEMLYMNHEVSSSRQIQLLITILLDSLRRNV
jgi:AcrR family transcriptional regulator